jgi:lysozyme family protein
MYSQAFQKALSFVLPHEDEYARGHWGDPKFVVTENVSGDSGGLTKYGIDIASHPGVDVKDLDLAGASAIYYKLWEEKNLDTLPEKLAICAFDVWVNGGHANLWLQEAYNRHRPSGAQALVCDGNLGPASIKALGALDATAITAVVKDFIAERNARFAALAANGKSKFLSGWDQRDTDLTAYLA